MRIFVSYSSKDRERVRALVEDLEGIGHDVWFDQELSGGQIWWDRIMANLRDCDLVIFALSLNWLNSYASGLEFSYAKALNKNCLPVRISMDVDLGLLPADIQSLQVVTYNPTERESLRQLARALTLTPPPASLPDPLPPAPPAPISEWAEISERLSELSLEMEAQQAILERIEGMIETQADRRNTTMLLHRLRVHPDASPATVRAVDDLLRSLEGAQANGRRGRGMGWYFAGGAALLALGAVLYLGFGRAVPQQAQSVPVSTSTVIPLATPTNAPSSTSDVIAAVDPTQVPGPPDEPGLIAFVGAGDLYVVQPDGDGLRNLTTDYEPEITETFYWAPDGAGLYVSRRDRCQFDELYTNCDVAAGLIPSDGGALQPFGELPCSDINDFWWPHRAGEIAAACHGAYPDDLDGAVYLIDLDGYVIHRYDLPGLSYCTIEACYDGWLRIAPDDSALAYECNLYGTGNQDLCLSSPDTGQTRALVASAEDESTPVWSPDGTRIAYLSNWDRERSAQTQSGQGVFLISPDGRDSFQALALSGTFSRNFLGWSADGQYLAFTQGDGDLWDVDDLRVLAADGSGDWLATPAGIERGYAASWFPYEWSRQGHSLLFVWGGDLYTYVPGDAQARNITNSLNEENCPAWSPDGRRIAFLRQEYGLYDLYVSNADGSGLIQITDTPQYSESCPQWSR